VAVALGTANLGTSGVEASSTTATVTLTGAVAAGETVFLFGASATGAGPTAISDNGPGRTWRVDSAESDTSPFGNANTFVAVGVKGSAMSVGNVITVTWGSAVFVRALGVSSFASVDDSAATATWEGAAGTASTAWATGALTVPSGGVMVSMAMLEIGGTTSTPNAGTNELLDWQIASAPTTQTACYRLDSGSQTLSGVWGASSNTSGVAATYASVSPADNTMKGGSAGMYGDDLLVEGWF
jgi:hypothetical protein